MNAVTLKANGDMVVGEDVVFNNPLMYLGYRVGLEATFTLRSFLSLFRHYPDLKKITAFIPETVFAMEQGAAREENVPIDCLEVTKTIEMIGFPNPPKLEIYTSLTGIGRSVPVDLKNVDAACLLDVLIRLGKLKHIVFGDKMDLLEFETVFTLFEFIDAILWELSFQGASASCVLRRS